MFFKTGVLKNFVTLTEKYLCWSLFLIKLTPKTPKKLQHRCLLVNIAKFLRTPFLCNTSGGCFCCFKKIRTFPGKHQWRRLTTFIFLINTTEYNKMLMCYKYFTYPCYLSNIPAVYKQRLEASGFHC